MGVVISIENVSKYYQLGSIGNRTLYQDLNRWWAKVRGRPDHLQKIGEPDHGNRDGECIWALRDVNLKVQQGEAMGIIGRNGAGKSTLLKIISQVTSPTRGQIKVKGRIASLLEVGTGFHPDLTGRENIYLNGAILGMLRQEIKSKFDEIVDFSGVEQFIDTPVKRYSSGMYVRLAFAVAAHLETEILLVDEVLAVGDSTFQKKCMGKMGTAAKDGRTVLFVSHNMGAVQSLCSHAILLHNGGMRNDGPAATIVSEYLTQDFEAASVKVWYDINSAPGDECVRMNAIRVVDKGGKPISSFDVREQIAIELRYWVLQEMKSLNTSCCFYNQRGEIAFHSRNDTMNLPEDKQKREPGYYISTCQIPQDLMNDGQYFVQVAVTDELAVHFFERDVVSFNVLDAMDPEGVRQNYVQEWPPAAVRPLLIWDNKKYSLTYPSHVGKDMSKKNCLIKDKWHG